MILPRRKLILPLLALTAAPGSVYATTAPPAPYGAFPTPADAIAYLHVISLTAKGETVTGFEATRLKLIRGQPVPAKVTLTIGMYCGFWSYPLVQGSEVIVYLKKDLKGAGTRACGWVAKDLGIKFDPFVASAFMEGTAAEKARAAQRAEEAYRFQGPIPKTPMERWPGMPPGELTLNRFDPKRLAEFPTRVKFEVGENGSVTSCRDLMTRPMDRTSASQAEANATLCGWLQKVGRFKPPLLPQEREGRMFWTQPLSRE